MTYSSFSSTPELEVEMQIFFPLTSGLISLTWRVAGDKMEGRVSAGLEVASETLWESPGTDYSSVSIQL